MGVFQLPPSLPQLAADLQTLDTHSSADELLAFREGIGIARSRLRDIEREFNERVIEWINEHGNIQVTDTVYLYVGRNKSYKPYKMTATLEALLKASRGDWDRFTDMLSANAIKPGAARKLLAEDFDDHFETREDETLRVKMADTAFT